MSDWFEFTVESGGRTYRCKRMVHGFRTTQVVIVTGVGSRHDPDLYGPGFLPLDGMEAAAHKLALEIISETRRLGGEVS